MNTAQPINVLGYIGNNKQFVVKTLNTDIRISQNSKHPELEGPNPYEYILAGFAGCINALGQLVAQEQGILLSSLQIEITGSLNQQDDATNVKPGFGSIEIKLKPAAAVPVEVLQKWLAEVQLRSPVYNTLVNNTPVNLILFKEFAYS
ncbi:OsmC family peroxiredoxin [Flavobacterium arcticum]|uniref:OsmC family peroxiredoxin n=1 Tax=Flavobacterium arcticum TaxID=1784713 RepID=A0A345H9P3_9FLAO|nr:OsmC family protein [Flavobacterium arcticum]AXG73303.1 OsmC family peroxiredoxin [Flavobacterium arcticum]KAF2513098.1 OsmC family protein [Flavobacterium arcticum]